MQKFKIKALRHINANSKKKRKPTRARRTRGAVAAKARETGPCSCRLRPRGGERNLLMRRAISRSEN